MSFIKWLIDYLSEKPVDTSHHEADLRAQYVLYRKDCAAVNTEAMSYDEFWASGYRRCTWRGRLCYAKPGTTEVLMYA
jgi:hypothetical protein